MIELTREIDGADDFELGHPRTTPLVYDITWPQEGEAAGVVLVIAGFGGDTSSGYSRSLRRHIVETTGMGAVSVRYHAFHARPTNGASLRMDNKEQIYLIGLAAVHKAPLTDASDIRSIARELGRRKVRSEAWAWIDPPSDERQNFGVVQALDHLRVIGDLMENAPAFDASRIVALGSSHGGYIAHLMAKMAPSTLAAVIDNSSYVQPPMAYLGVGGVAEVVLDYEGIHINARVNAGWTVSDRAAANFYSHDADLIRDLRFPPHVAAMRAAAEDAGTQYFMVNAAAEDPISRPEAKLRQQATLARAGFPVELALIGPGDIDGRVFKAMTHGLDCSLKGLFDRYIGRVHPRRVALDAAKGSVVAYECVERGYRFTHSASAPYVTAEIYDLFAEDEPATQSAAA